MSHRREIVILADKLSLFHGISCDYLAVVLPPFPLSLDKVVGVYPRFQGSFILGWKCLEGSDEYLFWKDNDILVVFLPLIVVSSSRQSISMPVRFP